MSLCCGRPDPSIAAPMPCTRPHVRLKSGGGIGEVNWDAVGCDCNGYSWKLLSGCWLLLHPIVCSRDSFKGFHGEASELGNLDEDYVSSFSTRNMVLISHIVHELIFCSDPQQCWSCAVALGVIFLLSSSSKQNEY